MKKCFFFLYPPTFIIIVLLNLFVILSSISIVLHTKILSLVASIYIITIRIVKFIIKEIRIISCTVLF